MNVDEMKRIVEGIHDTGKIWDYPPIGIIK